MLIPQYNSSDKFGDNLYPGKLVYEQNANLIWKNCARFSAVIIAGVSIACKCEDITVKDAVTLSDIVFKGIVISKTVTADFSIYGVTQQRNANPEKRYRTQYPQAVYKVKLEKIYKGKSSVDTITIITPAGGTSCGVSFQSGQQYMVYGVKKDLLFSEKSLKRSATNNGTFFTYSCL